MIKYISWMYQISKEHSTQKQQNKHSFQVHMEQSPGQITYQDKKQISTNLRGQKLQQAFFPPQQQYAARNQHRKKIVKLKHKETKEHATKKLTSCSHVKRHLLLGRKAITNLDSILKSRDITLLTKLWFFQQSCMDVTVGS